jgi:hypothetical protein
VALKAASCFHLRPPRDVLFQCTCSTSKTSGWLRFKNNLKHLFGQLARGWYDRRGRSLKLAINVHLNEFGVRPQGNLMLRLLNLSQVTSVRRNQFDAASGSEQKLICPRLKPDKYWLRSRILKFPSAANVAHGRILAATVAPGTATIVCNGLGIEPAPVPGTTVVVRLPISSRLRLDYTLEWNRGQVQVPRPGRRGTKLNRIGLWLAKLLP